MIPLMLNEYRFNQHARAIMEDRQMKRYPLFSRIGAFSINRQDRRSTVTSLRYAVKSMKRKNASLFIYPEGKLKAPGTDLSFEGGLAWLYDKLPNVDFVPVGIYIHTLRHDKPELHLHVGKPVKPDKKDTAKQQIFVFENELHQILELLWISAGFEDDTYEPFL